jgi:hypothetical protein
MLHGLLADSVCTSVLRIRKVIDKRIKKLVLGADAKDAPLSVSNQIKLACRAQIDKIDLIALAGVSASGSFKHEDPLRQFASIGAGKAEGVFAKGWNRLYTIIAYKTPTQSTNALSFSNRLTADVDNYLTRGATWKDLSRWYRSVIAEVTEDVREFSSGDKSTALLNFDIAILDNVNAKHNTTLASDIADSKAEATEQKLLKVAGNNHKGKPADADDGDDGGDGWAECGEQHEDHGDEHFAEEGLLDGDALQVAGPINKGYLKEIRKKHPPINGKSACYYHFQPGLSCNRGEHCDFHHGH